MTAVIIPGDLDAVLDVLDRRGSRAFHVSEAQGRPGPGAGATEIYKGAVYRSRTAARVRLEVVTPGTDACALMDEIAAACGRLSEGDIFAVDLLSRPRAGCARSNGAGRAEADPPQP